jgi:uncharacterized protein
MWRMFKNRQMTHFLRIACGWSFIVLGVVGLFLPLLQGVLFLVVGITLLAPYVPLFSRLREWLARRFPRAGKMAERVRKRFHHGIREKTV